MLLCMLLCAALWLGKAGGAFVLMRTTWLPFLCAGGLGAPWGQDIPPSAFIASVLQSRGFQEDILGEWEASLHPEVLEARAAFCDLVQLREILMRRSWILWSLFRGGFRETWAPFCARARTALHHGPGWPPRLQAVLSSSAISSLSHASAGLFALPMPRMWRAMLAIDSCRLRYYLCIPYLLLKLFALVVRLPWTRGKTTPHSAGKRQCL